MNWSHLELPTHAGEQAHVYAERVSKVAFRLACQVAYDARDAVVMETAQRLRRFRVWRDPYASRINDYIEHHFMLAQKRARRVQSSARPINPPPFAIPSRPGR
jgi:hypothetical protein